MTSFFADLPGKAAAAALIFLLAAGLCVAAGAVALQASQNFKDVTAEAVASAKAERDAYWKGEIARSNEEAANQKAIQAESAMRLEALTSSKIRDAEAQQKTTENANAALPSVSGCGLRRDRVRVLNAQ
ncbi:hypothetical protein SAMN05421890_1549 [Ensifer adhaerens]|nr:hypothetical protein SAMN05421890_1549 [Ensifer adhaerens]